MGGEFEVYEYLDDNKIFKDLKDFLMIVRVVDKFSPKVVNFSFLSTRLISWSLKIHIR